MSEKAPYGARLSRKFFAKLNKLRKFFTMARKFNSENLFL
jgi:hypothetical protein